MSSAYFSRHCRTGGLGLCSLTFSVAVMLVVAMTPLTAVGQTQSATIEFRHDPSVPLEYRHEIEEGVLLGQEYLLQVWAMELPEALLVESFASDGIPGYFRNGSLGFNAGSPVWIDTSSAQRIKIAIHEFWHAAESALDPGGRGAYWINEGAAEYFAYAAVIEKGLVDPAVVSAFHELNVIYAPGMVALEDLETVWDFSTGPVYSLAYLAVEQLVIDSGPGSVRDYLGLIGEGWLAHDAFEASFGTTLDDFYSEFAGLRASLLEPSVRVTGLLPPGPVLEYPSWVAVQSVTTPVEIGSQALVTVATDPSVRCVLDVYALDGTLLESRPTQADASGRAFWLWTIGEEFSGQPLPLAASCGGDPAWTAIDVT